MSNGRMIAPPTCGACRHWQQTPTNALNITGPAQGECRQQLHSIPVQQGNAMAFVCYYPTVPETFPACGMMSLRVSVE